MIVPLEHNAFGSEGAPVLILHGLLGSARNWTTIAKRLGDHARVFALDLRNHGSSSWADASTYDDMAEDVRAFIEERSLEPATLIGHSMGGKVAMRVALLYHDLVDRLVIVDIAPVPYRHSFDDYIDAMRSVDVAGTTRRSDVESELARAIPDPGVRAFLLQNLTRSEAGFEWRVNLDALAMNMEDIIGWPDTGVARFEGPTLFVAGERSDYLLPEHQGEIERLFPNAEIAVIKDAGHWVHAEQPAAFIERIETFLGRTA
jgi:esterase